MKQVQRCSVHQVVVHVFEICILRYIYTSLLLMPVVGSFPTSHHLSFKGAIIFTGRGASVRGGTRIFWGGQKGEEISAILHIGIMKGGPVFSVGQRGESM